MVLLVLLEALALQEVLALQEELARMYPKEQTEQTERLHLVVQTITMWLQDIAMLHIQERITITIIRQYTLTSTHIKLRLITMTVRVIMKMHTGITVDIIITHTMTDLMVAFITGMVTIGMPGDRITLDTHGLITHRMGTKNQTDTIPTMNLQVMAITTLWFITVLSVVMMGMFMRTLGYHTIAILTHIILIQVLTIITITILFHTPTQTLPRTMQVGLEGSMTEQPLVLEPLQGRLQTALLAQLALQVPQVPQVKMAGAEAGVLFWS
jgi:hypothetical protein